MKGHHPQRPIPGGRHKYNGVLPGAPRGSFPTPANYHPGATQPSARCLTPRLRWSCPVEGRTLASLQDQKSSLGGRGVSQMVVGSATFTRRAVLTRESCATMSPLGWD
jgi:hypothetical protein